MVDRIKQLMEFKELTSTQLADSIEVPRAIISHILSGRNKPSLDVVLKLLSCYREVDRNWMLFGEGEMLTNLASEDKLQKPITAANKEAESESAEVPKVAPLVEKVQIPVPPVDRAAADGKAVEQIMVLYSDKTFTAYRPS